MTLCDYSSHIYNVHVVKNNNNKIYLENRDIERYMVP